MSELKQLVVFDLDQTLLNKASELSELTLQTLRDMDSQGIHYTIATGRSFLSAARIIKDHTFGLPQIYTNGVVTWCPKQEQFSFDNCLTKDESLSALTAMESLSATPFISAINDEKQRIIFHSRFKNQIEQSVLERLSDHQDTLLMPIEQMAPDVRVTNISMIGPSEEVLSAEQNITSLKQIASYSGQAAEREDYRWIDIHHNGANKGAAIERLKTQLAVDSVICFGDGYNDLSMFDIADECYAPANANEQIKEKATQIIGHHDDDGVAKFLRERFSL
ncbi:HAD family hydrolase [Thalassotalea euphylliae]|uniref:HAD family hydrolase n=1 Tax=Thalassotalea euphylliae TaxID=1655234 RepID=UPI003626C2D2